MGTGHGEEERLMAALTPFWRSLILMIEMQNVTCNSCFQVDPEGRSELADYRAADSNI